MTASPGPPREHARRHQDPGGRIRHRQRQGIALARYNLDGTLDTSFGSRGKVLTHLSGKTNEVPNR